ncbi:MAG: hypothetical protein U5K79_23725 [Cyclobacteriaceae bacterium]|nr:hypothetical protein [Cyclobacteriaceae bacterium]
MKKQGYDITEVNGSDVSGTFTLRQRKSGFFRHHHAYRYTCLMATTLRIFMPTVWKTEAVL